jgi:predicted RNase H-like HicB family nuclease
MMNYPYRYPFSSFFAKHGATLSINIQVSHDEEANVYIATSDDVEGLFVEAESFERLRKEVEEAVPNLIAMEHRIKNNRTIADLLYKDHIAIA